MLPFQVHKLRISGGCEYTTAVVRGGRGAVGGPGWGAPPPGGGGARASYEPNIKIYWVNFLKEIR